jgi:hypothetical protein
MKAFQELQSHLYSEPIVDYTQTDRPYNYIYDASLGDDKKPGGMGATLTHTNKQNHHNIMAYTSYKN